MLLRSRAAAAQCSEDGSVRESNNLLAMLFIGVVGIS